MSEQRETPALGEPLRPGEGLRDAVHVAVFPAYCESPLSPGDPVRVVSGTMSGREYVAAPSSVDLADGVVDPFLKNPLPPGSTFYVLLKPGTVTGLRHVYFHPALTPVPPRRPGNG